jgi:isohexenylglutaconyl-CoA hydratase
MLTAARFDGREAQALGFADQVVDGAEALSAAEMDIRKRVLACAPGAVADLKALIHALPGLDRRATVQMAAENFADRLLSDEGKEGVASFLEKRKPRWVVEP